MADFEVSGERLGLFECRAFEDFKAFEYTFFNSLK